MQTSKLSTALLVAASLTLVSCGKAPSTTTPDGAVMASVYALRHNDLQGFLDCTFTADQISDMRGGWGMQMMEEPNASEKAEYAKMMTSLTEKDAEKTLMTQVEPALKQMQPQVESMLGMFEGMASMAMDSNDELSAAERQQGTQAIQAIVATLRKNDITDAGRARKAIGIVCRTARKLDLPTMEAIQALSFEAALGKGDHLLAGLKDVLDVYGFSIDSMLDSVEAKTVAQTGTTATVEVSYTLAGTRHTQQNEMILVAGRWVAKRDQPPQRPVEVQSGFSVGN